MDLLFLFFTSSQSQGIYLTSSLKYAEKYAYLLSKAPPSSSSAPTPLSTKPTAAVVIAAVIPGNSFPVIELIYFCDPVAGKFIAKKDSQGNIVYEKDKAGNIIYEDPINKKDPIPDMSNPESYLGRACKPGYQSHCVMGLFVFIFYFYVPVS